MLVPLLSDTEMDDEPNWIIINTNLDFDMKITFYQKHLNMLLILKLVD